MKHLKLFESSGKYPELDKLVIELSNKFAEEINNAVKDIESKMLYKAQYVLEDVAKNLQERV